MADPQNPHRVAADAVADDVRIDADDFAQIALRGGAGVESVQVVEDFATSRKAEGDQITRAVMRLAVGLSRL